MLKRCGNGVVQWRGKGVAEPGASDATLHALVWYNSETGATEPDCSPHPFDVMAIHALYQSVP